MFIQTMQELVGNIQQFAREIKMNNLEKDFEAEYEAFKKRNKVRIEKFEKQNEEAQNKINEQMEIASKAIGQAVKISEEYGYPFYGLSFLTQKYTPTSFQNKFESFIESLKGSDDEFIEALREEFEIYEDDYGWQRSDIC